MKDVKNNLDKDIFLGDVVFLTKIILIKGLGITHKNFKSDLLEGIMPTHPSSFIKKDL